MGSHLLTHSRSKTTMRRWFRVLFATVHHNKKEFLCKYVTMDETWIFHFTPESNQQSAEWTAGGENCPMQASAGKVLTSIFWDVQGILFTDYLEKGRTINSKYYIALLVHLKEEIAKNWPQMKKKNVLFHQDDVPCHKSIAMMVKLHELHFKLILYPPYSPDLTPATTGCLQTSKMLQGKIFGSNEEVISETETYFEAKDKSFYKKGIKLLEKC